MKKNTITRIKSNSVVRIATLAVATILFVALLSACSGSGAGGERSSGTGSCMAAGTYEVAWEFSGSYAEGVSVATTYVTPTGDTEDLGDGAHINPSPGVLLSESLPGCSSAGINVVMLDGAGTTDFVTLSNFTLSIYVDGTLADSVTYDGSYAVDNGGGSPTILPPSGALTVIVGQ